MVSEVCKLEEARCWSCILNHITFVSAYVVILAIMAAFVYFTRLQMASAPGNELNSK